MVLDVILHLTTATVNGLINPCIPRRLQIGDNKTHVLALIGDFYLTDDPTRL
jgi:hypothetical protein